MSVRHAFRNIFAVMLCTLLLGATSSQAATEVARAVAITPGVFVKRDGAQLPLRIKDPLYKGDAVSTDATGKAQLLFADDTTVALAPGSSINIDDFSYNTSATPTFFMSVGKGVARVVTGKIVQKNREGFKVRTPHATVGIRGTILTADVSTPAKSIFILTQLGSGHTVTVDNPVTREHTQMDKAGLSVEAANTGNILRPATPAEMNTAQTVARQTKAPQATAQAQGSAPILSQNTGLATASAASASGTTAALANTAMSTNAMSALGFSEALDQNEQSNAQLRSSQTNLNTRLAETGIQTGSMNNVAGLDASYAGTLSGGTGTGTFSFDLNLASGVLNNGHLSATNGVATYTGANGSGHIQSSGNAPPFSLWFNEVQGPTNNANAYVSGSFNNDKSQATVDQWAVRTGSGSLSTSGTIMGGTSGSAQKKP